jgi:hypothetical protein
MLPFGRDVHVAEGDAYSHFLAHQRAERAKGADYASLLGGGIKSSFALGIGKAKIKYYLKEDAAGASYHCFDSVLAGLVTMARKLAGKRLNPLQVSLTRARVLTSTDLEGTGAPPAGARTGGFVRRLPSDPVRRFATGKTRRML